jgi:hypothetical protein
MAELDYIQKSEKRVNNQYRFVSHDQVTAAIHPMLVKHRILIIPHTKEIKQDQNRTEVIMKITLVNPDNPSEFFYVDFPGYGIDTGDKGVGKAISYAFKYAVLKLFCLETGDDPDNDQNAVYEPEKCLDFDLALIANGASKERQKKIQQFLEQTAKETGKHVESLKAAALKGMKEFMNAFEKWESK